MTLEFSKYFRKRLLNKQKGVRAQLRTRLELFLAEPHHPQLRNHALQGARVGYRSIDITGDIRAVFKQYEDVARFIDIGTHSELYG